jgi:hypothetical protein
MNVALYGQNEHHLHQVVGLRINVVVRYPSDHLINMYT